MDDFLFLNDLYTSEQSLIKNEVDKWVEARVIPDIATHFEKATFPKELIPEIAKLGLLGMTLPENYGGQNADYITYGLVCEALEKGDSALRSFVSVQSSLCMHSIFETGSDEQKERFLKPMSQGKVIGCFGLTEPDAGSDPSAMKTHAKKVDGGYSLNGSKIWITNAPFADIAIIWAKVDDIVRGFIVEKDFKGYTTKEMHHKFSLRASSTGEIYLDDCFVPEENVLPKSNGLGSALKCLTQARYGIVWGAMGAAKACFEEALRYTCDRKQFSVPLASKQLIQKDLADMFNEIVKAEAYQFRLGQLMNEGKATYNHVSLGKMNACREAINIARMSRNLLGANGISLEFSVIRHLANLETVFTYEGTDNVHHLIIGKYLTGISAF